jgi:pimeloyl-ACP methyl ester carboxylesterase
MGGTVGYAIAKYAPERFYSLIIGGQHPGARSREGSRKGFSKGMEVYLENIPNSPGLVVTDWYKTRRLANDHEALIACSIDDGIEDFLPTMTMPCLLYAGEADPYFAQVKELVKRIPNATFFSLPGLGHGQAFRYSDQPLPHVKKFLAEVESGMKA